MGFNGLRTLLLILWMKTTIHVVSSFSTTEASVTREVTIIAGNAAKLPCDVDIDSCTSPVFSIKVYKNGERVYVYSVSNGTVDVDMADGDFTQPTPRAQLDLDADPPEINVREIYLRDEGIYRCDVTYLVAKESCATVAYTKLITWNKPSYLEMKFDGGTAENTSRIGPFIEGTQLSLSCEASGAKPAAEITWWNNTQRFGADEDDEGQHTASTINVKLTRNDLRSRFQCQAMNEALDVPMVTWVDVDVHVRPLDMRILPLDKPMVEEHRVSLVCEATGARPAVQIEWFNDTKELLAESGNDIIERVIEENGEEGTLTTRSTLTFLATNYSDDIKIKCSGSNLVMDIRNEPPLETILLLDVQYKPRVSIQPEGNYEVNSSSSVDIICSYDANPRNLSKIVWLKDGEEFEPKDDNYIETFKEIESEETNENDDTDEDEDDIHPVLRIKSASYEDKGIYSCVLTNDVGSGTSTTTLELDVFFPPLVDVELIPNLITEDEGNVTLSCTVIDAYPSEIFAYNWLKNGELIGETVNNTFVLTDLDRFDVGNYSCVAQNSYGWGIESESEELLVQYLPGISFITHDPLTIIKGDRLEITCNTKDKGYPPANEYLWYRDDVRLTATNRLIVIESVNVLMLSNFSCAPVNEVGVGPFATRLFPVMAPPNFIQDLPQNHGELVDATSVILTCQVECLPKCVIHWVRNGEHLKNDSELYYIKTAEEGPNVHKQLFHSVVSTLYWNLTAWPTGHLRRDVDNANYSCVSSDNFARRGVESTTYFRVEYPPENIIVIPEVVNVTENNIPPEIHCYASGFPQPSYVWTKLIDDVKYIVSDNQTLALNFPIMRNQSGDYVCEASNQRGNQTIVTFINVLYEPSCAVRKKGQENGVVLITCEILAANPQDLNFDWLFKNGNLSDDIRINEERNILSFQEKEGLDHVYGNYTCIVSNSIGVAVCSADITSEGSWLEKVAKNRDIFMWAAIIAAFLLVVAIVTLYCLCRRKTAAEGARKLSVETRQNPEGIQTDISHILHPPRVTFKKCASPNRLTRVRFSKTDGSTPADGKKKKASLPRDGDKAFYENLPFHGLQPPPNKTSKPVPAPRKLNFIPIKQKPVYENVAFFPKLLVQPVFRKNPTIDVTNVNANDGIIYADLQLANGNKHEIIRRDTPTEYAVLNFNGKNDFSEA